MPSLSSAEVSARLAGAKSYSDVDVAVMQMIEAGELPSYIEETAGWPTLTISENGHTLKIRYSPTYATLGVDAYPIGRATPFLAQAIATRLHSVLPSRKVMALIQRATEKFPYVDIKVAPWNIPGDQIQTQAALDTADKAIRKALADHGITPEEAGYGFRKSILSGPKLDGSQVAIGGGVWDLSTFKTVQPYSTIHSALGYADDSHGHGPFILRVAELDGRTVDLIDDVALSSDPVIVGLWNDYHSTTTGLLERYDPTFPNLKSNSATYAMISGEDDTDTDFSAFGTAGEAPAAMSIGGGVTTTGDGVTQQAGSSPSLVRAIGGGLLGLFLGGAIGGPAGAAAGGVYGAGLGAVSSIRR